MTRTLHCIIEPSRPLFPLTVCLSSLHMATASATHLSPPHFVIRLRNSRLQPRRTLPDLDSPYSMCNQWTPLVFKLLKPNRGSGDFFFLPPFPQPALHSRRIRRPTPG
ncbi:hypothetical protein BDN72DRAFT_48322 [Pluteus cervinus]|uniref:Uncharacterized protein n=1 Tax=Pluteus cervinus TaxID=181527 RepID=A0ACD3BHL4_9AGAR|nr:hypothetical protein BDN72DRAFT_48322 [Pluteus cervinus]